MCGRFTLTSRDIDEAARAFAAEVAREHARLYRPRWNVAPRQAWVIDDAVACERSEIERWSWVASPVAARVLGGEPRRRKDALPHCGQRSGEAPRDATATEGGRIRWSGARRTTAQTVSGSDIRSPLPPLRHECHLAFFVRSKAGPFFVTSS
jgi:hypothetical protein